MCSMYAVQCTVCDSFSFKLSAACIRRMMSSKRIWQRQSHFICVRRGWWWWCFVISFSSLDSFLFFCFLKWSWRWQWLFKCTDVLRWNVRDVRACARQFALGVLYSVHRMQMLIWIVKPLTANVIHRNNHSHRMDCSCSYVHTYTICYLCVYVNVLAVLWLNSPQMISAFSCQLWCFFFFFLCSLFFLCRDVVYFGEMNWNPIHIWWVFKGIRTVFILSRSCTGKLVQKLWWWGRRRWQWQRQR